MNSKILAYVAFFTLILFSFTACQSNSASPDPSAPQTPAAENGVSLSVEEAYTNFDKNDSEAGTAVAVVLADNGTTVSGAGVTVDKNTVTVTAGGTYRVSGTLSNGQLRVNVAKTDKVRLILDGVNITCQNGAPLYILSADKTAITLAAGTFFLICRKLNSMASRSISTQVRRKKESLNREPSFAVIFSILSFF